MTAKDLINAQYEKPKFTKVKRIKFWAKVPKNYEVISISADELLIRKNQEIKNNYFKK